MIYMIEEELESIKLLDVAYDGVSASPIGVFMW
jgi:hypothetical protein